MNSGAPRLPTLEEIVPAEMIRSGRVHLPSVFKDPDGHPLFAMTIPSSLWHDAGMRYLIAHEHLFGGYEYPSRAFLLAHLSPGDVFVDVGAHWGVFSLTVAAHFKNAVDVVAVEPSPFNVLHAMDWAARNGVTANFEIVHAAAGAANGLAQLGFNTTMGNRLTSRGTARVREDKARIHVPVVTVDGLIEQRADLADRRIFLKIDTEGFEAEVLAGSEALLESGRVAAVIWEYAGAGGDQDAAGILARLDALGYRSHCFPVHNFGGPLVPFVPGAAPGNVFSLAATISPLRAYPKSLGKSGAGPAAPPRPGPSDIDSLAAHTEALIAARAPGGLEIDREAANRRAAMAAPYIPAGARLLDLGAGSLALTEILTSGGTYVPADIVQRHPATVIVDLNRGEFPAGAYDCIVALDLFPYLFDLPSLLARIAATAPLLIFSYPPREGEPRKVRRAHGWYNDYEEDELAALLAAAGFEIAEAAELDDERIFVCRRTEERL